MTYNLPKDWQIAPFSQILTKVDRKFIINDGEEYNCVGVRWYGNGAFIREKLLGANIGRKQQWIIKQGDVVYNKLFAWKNAFAIADERVDDCIVSDKFPTYRIKSDLINPQYLAYYFKTPQIALQAHDLSKGAAAISKLTLNPPQFWDLTIPLPPLAEQRRIVERIEALTARVTEAQALRKAIDYEIDQMLYGAFESISEGASYVQMKYIAPIVRRPVYVDSSIDYLELGVRSFGKGTFHKPALNGALVGTKRLFEIKPGDLVFSNVFAWEGGIAVAKPEDVGRVGSHRFITCVAKEGLATSSYLCYYFLTKEGLEKIGTASPGGAGRNRTLGLNALENISVPIPDYKKQIWFMELLRKVSLLRNQQTDVSRNLDAIIPSIIDKAFKGEL